MKNKQLSICAIDPGISGGLAFKLTGQDAQAYPMPDDDDLAVQLSNFAANKPCVVYLELVGGFMRGTNKEGIEKNIAAADKMFVFGQNFGFIRGCCKALKIRLVLVVPRRWQKNLDGLAGLTTRDGPKRKRILKQHAARLFPDLKPTLLTADALCILAYACKIEQGGEALPGVVAIEQPESEVRDPAKPTPLEIENMTMRQQVPLAVAWCKAGGFKVPDMHTDEFRSMFDYWYIKAINGLI